jgi:ribonuclease HII
LAVHCGNISHLLSKSIAELRDLFLSGERPAPEGLLEALESDSRNGARRLAAIIRKRILKNHQEEQRLHLLLRYELDLWAQGFRLIAGVDEAGMAPLAGPVVAAAVILPHNYKLAGLDDSKKVAECRRNELAVRIKQDAICWSVGRAEPEEIDNINIYHSGLLAMRRAVEGLSAKPEYILVDARTIPHCLCPQRGIIHGDALSATIAAASIIAKTTRDAHMIDMDRIYSGYGFALHKGYPTPEHLRILKEKGPTPIHRKSFAPVRETLWLDPAQRPLFP